MTALASHLDPMIPTEILVVDPKPSDYDCLLPVAAAEGCEVRFFAAGRAVLRQGAKCAAGL